MQKELTMQRSTWKNPGRAILIAVTLVLLSAGTGPAPAQPGAEFQNQGIREDMGLPTIRGAYVRRHSRSVRNWPYIHRRW